MKQVRNTRQCLRATDDEFERIQEGARKEGCSVNEFMIRASLERASGELEIAKQVLREELRRLPDEMKVMLSIWPNQQ